MAAGAVSLKNLTKREEVRKGADQAKWLYRRKYLIFTLIRCFLVSDFLIISLIGSFSYTLQNVRYLAFCKVFLKSIKYKPYKM